MSRAIYFRDVCKAHIFRKISRRKIFILPLQLKGQAVKRENKSPQTDIPSAKREN